MKRGNIIHLVFIALSICCFANLTFAQNTSNAITKQERAVEAFSAINVGETFIITYTTAENYSLVVETNENKQDQISTKLTNGVLNIKNNSLRSPGVLNIYITAPYLSEIYLSGASEFYAKEVMPTETLKVVISGAAIADINVNTKQLVLDLHGASELILHGNAELLDANLDGTASLTASDLETVNGTINNRSRTASNVNVSDTLTITSNSTNNIMYAGTPKKVNKNTTNSYRSERSQNSYRDNSRDDESYIVRRNYRSNSRYGFRSLNVRVGDRGDSTVVELGRHQFLVDEYGNTRYRKIYRNRFNGHWGGFDLGINGYLTNDFNMDFPAGYDFLDLNLGKSTRIDINLFEQNLPISKDNHWGFITGIGFEYRNYSFDNNISLVSDEAGIMGYRNEGAITEKNKMTVNYINIPIIFEYQTNAYNERNSFHLSVGMVFGLRYASKTKRVFDNKNVDINLLDENDLTVRTVNYDKNKIKEHNSFHLNPVKADAMLRFGWGWFNFYATYSVTEMFKKNEGPELYPFSVGMTLLKW